MSTQTRISFNWKQRRVFIILDPMLFSRLSPKHQNLNQSDNNGSGVAACQTTGHLIGQETLSTLISMGNERSSTGLNERDLMLISDSQNIFIIIFQANDRRLSIKYDHLVCEVSLICMWDSLSVTDLYLFLFFYLYLFVLNRTKSKLQVTSCDSCKFSMMMS